MGLRPGLRPKPQDLSPSARVDASIFPLSKAAGHTLRSDYLAGRQGNAGMRPERRARAGVDGGLRAASHPLFPGRYPPPTARRQMIAGRYKDLRTSSGAPARECTLACVKNGGKYVFVMKGKVYKIANQNLAALPLNAGNSSVQLTGDIQGDTITVSEITVPEKK